MIEKKQELNFQIVRLKYDENIKFKDKTTTTTS